MRLLSVGVCLLAICASVFGQSDRGTITGTVLDPTGAAVPNARVTVTNVDTAASVTSVTTSAGDYTVPSLTAGAYSITVEAAGFRRI